MGPTYEASSLQLYYSRVNPFTLNDDESVSGVVCKWASSTDGLGYAALEGGSLQSSPRHPALGLDAGPLLVDGAEPATRG